MSVSERVSSVGRSVWWGPWDQMMEKIKQCISRERVRMIYKQKQTIRLSRTRDVTDKHDRGAVQFRARRRIFIRGIQSNFEMMMRARLTSLSPSLPPFPFFAHTVVCIGSVDFDARCSCCCLMTVKWKNHELLLLSNFYDISYLSLSLCVRMGTLL